jgi:hypothetical protein
MEPGTTLKQHLLLPNRRTYEILGDRQCDPRRAKTPHWVAPPLHTHLCATFCSERRSWRCLILKLTSEASNASLLPTGKG